MVHTPSMIWQLQSVIWIHFPPKLLIFFPKNFLNFNSDMIEKQGIIKLGSYSNKSHASVVLSDSRSPFLGKGEDAVFLSIMFCLYTALYNQSIISSNFLVFHNSGVLSKSAAFIYFFRIASFSVKFPSDV